MAVDGGVFLPWDGKGHKTMDDAEIEMEKLAKKRRFVDYQWRVVEYASGRVCCVHSAEGQSK